MKQNVELVHKIWSSLSSIAILTMLSDSVVWEVCDHKVSTDMSFTCGELCASICPDSIEEKSAGVFFVSIYR